jgi:hypothetical protein
MIMESSAITCEIIRSHILQFVRTREKAYKAVLAKGGHVPEYELKCKAIKMLYIQIEASATWNLRAQVAWIFAMRHLLTTLLPAETNPDMKLLKYRQRMINLFNYCDDLYLANQQLKLPIAV